MIVFYAENPSTFINGISLSNKELFKIFKTKKKFYGLKNLVKENYLKNFFLYSKFLKQ